MPRYDVGTDHVGRITLDRPDAKNAFSAEMRDGLVDVVRSARVDPWVRALLVTGTGDSFCAEMDLRASTVSQAGGAASTPAPPVRRCGPGSRPSSASCGSWTSRRWPPSTARRWGRGRLPAAAAGRPAPGQGHGAAGGEGGGGGSGRRRSRLPLPRIGGGAGGRGRGRCPGRPPAGGPTRSLGLSKQLLNTGFESTLPVSLEREGAAQALATVSPEMAEGMAAFKEKRAPRFAGPDA